MPDFVFVPVTLLEGNGWEIATLCKGCKEYQRLPPESNQCMETLELAQSVATSANLNLGWPTPEEAFVASKAWAPSRE